MIRCRDETKFDRSVIIDRRGNVSRTVALYYIIVNIYIYIIVRYQYSCSAMYRTVAIRRYDTAFRIFICIIRLGTYRYKYIMCPSEYITGIYINDILYTYNVYYIIIVLCIFIRSIVVVVVVVYVQTGCAQSIDPRPAVLDSVRNARFRAQTFSI